MPLDLTKQSDLEKLIQGINQKVTAKLFDKDLTGNGRSTVGLFTSAFSQLDQIDAAGDLKTVHEYEQDHHLWAGLDPDDKNKWIDTFYRVNKLFDYNGYDLITTKDSPNMFGLTDVNERWINLMTTKDYKVWATNFVTNIFLSEKVHKGQTGTYTTTKYTPAVMPAMMIGPADTNDYSTLKLNLTEDPDDFVKALSTDSASIIITDSSLMDVLLADVAHALEDEAQVQQTYQNTYWLKPFVDPNSPDTEIEQLIASDHTATDGLTKLEQQNIAHLLSCQANDLVENVIKDTKWLLNLNATNIKNHYQNQTIQQDNYFDEALETLRNFNEQANMLSKYLTSSDFTDLYRCIEDIQQNIIQLKQSQLSRLVSTNLRLLLSQQLSKLQVLKDNKMLYQFNPTNPAADQMVQNSKNFSNQQKALIQTKEPLSIETAGAGSGKSHTLVGRLEYLKQQGEDLKKIMVLSFTNTAADNIIKRYPGICSITLGNLFNQIYSATFPAQTLSAPETVVNALDMLSIHSSYFAQFNSSTLADSQTKLIDLLDGFIQKGFKKVDLASQTAKLLTFINDNLTDTAILLNAVQQTTLELQPIVIFAMLNQQQMPTVPQQFQNLNFIITDESQDISTFEYILLLNLTIMYHANLTIIGDGSQTLYEFRNSNPQFLNAIEASKLFTTFRLTTNYRSRPEILSYANEFLSIIDANKYAHIQLQPNQLSAVTEVSFADHVHVNELDVSTIKGQAYFDELEDTLQHNQDFRKWIVAEYQQKHQIAMLAFLRKEVDLLSRVIQTILRQDLGVTDPKLINLAPDRQRSQTMLSRALRELGPKLENYDLATYAVDFKNDIDETVKSFFKNAQKAFVPKYINDITHQLFTSAQYKIWLQSIANHTRTEKQLAGFIRQYCLNAEIQTNAIQNLLNRNQNTQQIATQLSSAELVTSTIHSAKGLEFDSVVCLYNESRRNAHTQEQLRLFGVALTRAKDKEYIVNVHHDPKNITRSVSSDQTSMFKTPMSTARLRVIDKINKSTINNGNGPVDPHPEPTAKLPIK